MRSDWIQTAMGLAMYPLAPSDDMISIRDIAHALSHVCRFTGHTSRFYSVGEHSVRVSRYLLASGCMPDTRIALFGLLHDASEAYLADVSAPLKALPEFEAYRKIEKNLQGAIYRRFGLDGDEPAELRDADLVLLATEKRELLGPEPQAWGPLPAPLAFTDWMGWDPGYAEDQFLRVFNLLGGKS